MLSTYAKMHARHGCLQHAIDGGYKHIPDLSCYFDYLPNSVRQEYLCGYGALMPWKDQHVLFVDDGAEEIADMLAHNLECAYLDVAFVAKQGLIVHEGSDPDGWPGYFTRAESLFERIDSGEGLPLAGAIVLPEQPWGRLRIDKLFNKPVRKLGFPVLGWGVTGNNLSEGKKMIVAGEVYEWLETPK